MSRQTTSFSDDFQMLILLASLVGVPCPSVLSGHYTTSYGVVARLVGAASILPASNQKKRFRHLVLTDRVGAVEGEKR